MEDFLEASAKVEGGLNLQKLVNEGGLHFQIARGRNFMGAEEEEFNVDLSDIIFGVDHEKSKELVDGKRSIIFHHPILKEVRDCKNFYSFLRMTSPVTNDGEIQKMIVRKGSGKQVADGAQVWIHYISFPEGSSEPFDSTEKRKNLFSFKLNGEKLPGLDLSVRSMDFNEVSLFIVSPKYAYGYVGHPPRIQPNTRILFLIELLEMNSSIETPFFAKSPEQRQQAGFQATYKEAERIKNAGNTKVNNEDYYGAIDCYNIALEIIREFSTYEDSERKQRDQLLYKIYSNKAECYLRVDDPLSTCETFREAFWQKVPFNDGKLIFRFAKGLLQSGDSEYALKAVEVALKIEPNHPQILRLKDEVLAVLAEENVESLEMWKKIGLAHFNNGGGGGDDQQKTTKESSGPILPASVVSTPNPMKNVLQQFSAQSALSQLFGNKLKF